MMFSAALSQATDLLQSSSETPQLDAEVLLAKLLNVPRSFLYAWPEKLLTEMEISHFFKWIKRREQGEPVAYLLNQQEFWSLNFFVTPEVLVPRPETEILVEWILNSFTADHLKIADLGCGSGAIGIALAQEKPQWYIYATDISEEALAVAKKNSENLQQTNTHFIYGDWCSAFLPGMQLDVVVSNPPYLSEHEFLLRRKQLGHEPKSALVAGETGLESLQQIITEAKSLLKPGGALFLEHGFMQADAVKKLCEQAGYQKIEQRQDYAGLDRATRCVLPGE